MSECNSSIVSKLLDQQTSEQETGELEDHLATCQSCQQALARAAGGDQMALYVGEMLSSSMEISQWSNRDWSGSMEMGAPSRIECDQPTQEESLDTRNGMAIDLSMLSPSDDPETMGRIGNYEIQGVLGRGGMGVVFRGLDRALHRNVAIKVLDPALSSLAAARQRFALEARAMAAISHEHVVPVYTVDTHRGLPYFAMEYVPGGTLEARIRKCGPLDLISILQISRQIALALSAAHECGLVHRDIKPANVLLDRGVDRVRVSDFGLARVSSDASFTRSGFVAGTPQFMSPEQVRGEVCNGLSDLFSLGCVMYAMCTGHSPFRCESVYGSMQRVVHDEPRSIREQNAFVPDWLEQFIKKLLAKHASDRFENAMIVATELEHEIAYLQNPSEALTPRRDWYASNGIQHRRTWLPSLLVGAVTLAAIVVVGTLWVQNPKPETDQTKPDTLSLWDKDGTREAQSLAKSIEDSLFKNNPLNAPDPWSKDVMQMQQTMNNMLQEYP